MNHRNTIYLLVALTLIPQLLLTYVYVENPLIEGEVLEAHSGNLISGADILVLRWRYGWRFSRGWDRIGHTNTDENGHYQFRLLKDVGHIIIYPDDSSTPGFGHLPVTMSLTPSGDDFLEVRLAC